MVTSNNIFQAEEEFSRYHDKLRRELNQANWHLSVVRYISNSSSEYLQELNQSPAFWGLTITAHMYSVLMRLNNFFTRNKPKEDAHLHMPSFLTFVEKNREIFSAEAFKRRLRTVGRYDEIAAEFKPSITPEKVQQDRQKLRDLPLSGLVAWRKRILSHINKEDIAQKVDIAKKYPVKTKHIAEIIETLHNMLNEYCLAFDFSTHSKDLTIESDIEYILEAVKFKLEIQKKSR